MNSWTLCARATPTCTRAHVVVAIRRVEGHYEASRYPEETTKYFYCLAEQAACQHYPEALSSILADVDIIYSWAEELIFRSPNSEV